MELNETWQEARSQHPLPSLCFSGWSEKTRWPPSPLIGWDIFDFSSETAERNATKLDRKQDLNVLYQVCVFRADRKNNMAALATDWMRHFRLLLWNRWMEFNKTWQEARSQHPLPSLSFAGRSVNKNVCLGRFLQKVAHCTQVHDMWLFGPLVLRYRANVLLMYNGSWILLSLYNGVTTIWSSQKILTMPVYFVRINIHYICSYHEIEPFPTLGLCSSEGKWHDNGLFVFRT